MRKAIVTASLVGLLACQPVLAQTATAPSISSVAVSSTATTAVVSWTTSNVASTSYVDFGLTDVYGNTLGNGTPVTVHSVTLLGLTPGTQYHFRVRSMEPVSNLESKSTDTIFPTAATTVNANANTNTETNKNSNTNSTNGNTNTANVNTNKNTNASKNANSTTNANKNTNAAKNANVNSNKNANVNTNSGVDLFNQNTNESVNANTTNDSLDNTNTDLTNVNAVTPDDSSDGRAGIVLIAIGVLLLVGIIGFAWWKARKPPVVRP